MTGISNAGGRCQHRDGGSRLAVRSALPVATRWWFNAFGWTLALVLFLPSLANAACSAQLGKVVINEYNYINNYIELKVLDSSLTEGGANPFAGWKLAVWKKQGGGMTRGQEENVSSNYTNSAKNTCQASGNYTYVQIPFSGSNMTNDTIVVLWDSTGGNKLVDLLRIGQSGLQAYPASINSGYSEYEQCATIENALPSATYDAPLTGSSGNKDIAKLPDGNGPWVISTGTGANSQESLCSTNDALLQITKTPSSATVGVGSASTFDWTLTVKNNGSSGDMSNVTVADTLPADMLLATCPTGASCAGSAGAYSSFSRNVGTLVAGASSTITATAYVTAAGIYANTASAQATELLPGYTQATGTVTASPTVNHYAISYPLGSTGVTCEALAVTVTGHDSADAATAPPAGTQITLATSPATGGWALRSGLGTFTAPDKYTFGGGETAVDFWLTQTTPLANIDVDVTDGSKTDKDGDASEDAKASFADTAFKYYACSGAVPGTCSEVAINTQVAGIDSNAMPAAQNLYLRAVKAASTTGACVGALAGAQNVEWGYECNAPANCAGSNFLSVNGGVATTIERNNGSTISATTGTYTPSVAMTFDANGFAPFNLRYSDVGKITLHARKTLAAGVGTPPSAAALLYGASNALVVKPYGFRLSGISCSNNFSPEASAFCPAGETFAGMVSAVRYDNTASNNLGSTTPSFGQEGQTVSFSPKLVSPAGGEAGTVMSVLGPWSAGDAAIALNWSDVGEIRLTPTVDYFALGDLTSGGKTDSENFFGQRRFYPYRMALADNGSAEACAAGNLTYAGQPFSLGFTLTAIRKDGNAVRNYGLTTAFTTTGAAISVAAENADSGSNLGANIKTDPAGVVPAFTLTWPSGVPADAVATVAAASYRYDRPASPFAALDSMNIGFLLQDDSGDSVPLAAGDFNPTTIGACSPSSCNARAMFDTSLRYGRARIDNAFGSAVVPLKVNIRAEYYKDATDQWRTNTLDVCNKLVTVPASASNGGLVFFAQTTSNQLAAGEVLAEIAGSTSIAPVNMPFAAGLSSILLRSPTSATAGPGTANFGYVELDFLASGFAWPSWLPTASPSSRARASFGLYKGSDRIIYRREVR